MSTREELESFRKSQLREKEDQDILRLHEITQLQITISEQKQEIIDISGKREILDHDNSLLERELLSKSEDIENHKKELSTL